MKYSLKEIKPNIFAVIVPDNYERAMLFCRVQEFYESPKKKFKNNKFSIWDFFQWYSKKWGDGCFSYPKDYVGYNLPLIVAKKCYEVNKPETPYDLEMIKIINLLFENGKKKYLIGVDEIKSSIFDHELAHGLYYTNINYTNNMNEIIKKISKSNIKKLRKNLKELGYCSGVFKDEVQAYMTTEINKKVTKGVPDKKRLHQKFKIIFKKYK
jgi:hypothetical protein